ncbi:MAG: beta-ketoacyl-ACP synthase II [Chitinophagales bacterium]|nr:beta-ketoacyl-ACP synthase II [Bacteroidota bacterium]MCB9042375.1 beta-ketoacyl-ACP synthase II [Chitinophagales bacterium]
MKLKRVVVTGLGALTPIGNNLVDYWNALEKGVSGAAIITRFDPSYCKTQFACELKNFNAGDYIDRRELRRLDPFAQYALIASDEAINDAGLLDNPSVNRERVGVIWSSGIGGLLTFQEQIREHTLAGFDQPFKYNPFFIPKMISDIAAGHISIKNGFKGPNFSVVAACASSTNACIDAFNYIRLGMADVVVTGGSEAAITEAGIGGFNALKALSERNESPETASRPFDLDRDGFVLGEGAASLVLEELEHALNRGARIYAEVLGGGMSADAHHITAPHPEGEGARLVMYAVLKDAKLSPTDIDYINVHGTSTPLGDIAEIKAIQELFGENTFNLNISSTKSMTGHLLGAAGAVEALACIMAINKDIIPPTINHFTDDPAFDSRLNLTFNKAQKREVRNALSNTFGFGGHNASLIFSKYEEDDSND